MVRPAGSGSAAQPAEAFPQCQRAAAFQGRYVLRCKPVDLGNGDQDQSYTASAIRIHSVSPFGNISTHGRFSPVLDPRWNDDQWRAVTPEEAPKAYLLDRCHQLSKDKEDACVNGVGSLCRHIWINPFSKGTMSQDLMKQCSQKANEPKACQRLVQGLMDDFSPQTSPEEDFRIHRMFWE